MEILAATATHPNAADNIGAILALVVIIGALLFVAVFMIKKLPGGKKIGPEPKTVISKIIGKNR